MKHWLFLAGVLAWGICAGADLVIDGKPIQVEEVYTHRSGNVLVRITPPDQPTINYRGQYPEPTRRTLPEQAFPYGWFYGNPSSGKLHQLKLGLRYRTSASSLPVAELFRVTPDRTEFEMEVFPGMGLRTQLPKARGWYSHAPSERRTQRIGRLDFQVGSSKLPFILHINSAKAIHGQLESNRLTLERLPASRILDNVYEHPDGTLYVFDLPAFPQPGANLAKDSFVLKVMSGKIEKLRLETLEMGISNRRGEWVVLRSHLQNGDMLEHLASRGSQALLLSDLDLTPLQHVQFRTAEEFESMTGISTEPYRVPLLHTPCRIFLEEAL